MSIFVEYCPRGDPKGSEEVLYWVKPRVVANREELFRQKRAQRAGNSSLWKTSLVIAGVLSLFS